MKPLTIFQQLQFAIIILFFLAFVFCFASVLIRAEVSDIVMSTFNELKTLFLALMSVEGIKRIIARDSGLETDNEKDKPVDNSAVS